jgi:hypothetical protein
VLRIIPFIGNPLRIAHGVSFVPSFTSHARPIDEKRKSAFFNSLSLLYSKAFSVLSNEIEPIAANVRRSMNYEV